MLSYALVYFTTEKALSSRKPRKLQFQARRVLSHFPYLFLVETTSQHHVSELPPPAQELLDEIGKRCSIQNILLGPVGVVTDTNMVSFS